VLNDLVALYSDSVALFSASVFALGLVIGSFLNVVIYRLPIIMEREWRAQARELLFPAEGAANDAEGVAPERFSLSMPRSACPSCKAPISTWQNIPVISWLALGGKCAACKARISVRYPLVEFATACLSAWVAWHFGFGAAAACALLVTWFLIALTVIDVDHQLLPDSITLPLLWAGLLAAGAIGPIAGSPLPVSPWDAILGAAFRFVTGKEGMGYGDFKLLAALGAWLGWKLLPLVILLSAATGAALGIAMILLRGRNRSTPMPFGPYLASAGWLALMYGDSLVSAYLRVSGLHR